MQGELEQLALGAVGGAAEMERRARRAGGGPGLLVLGSDNAALYAKYLLEIRLGLPCGLASMSTT
ncbi:glucosamine-6-phosphate deaminase, partial [Streptomyces sp. NPDC079189]